jgi:hypothetical protein
MQPGKATSKSELTRTHWQMTGKIIFGKISFARVLRKYIFSSAQQGNTTTVGLRTKRNPWHARTRSARHLHYMNGRHTRDRVRSAHPTRVSHAAGAASRNADVVHMMRASIRDIRVANAM